MFFHLQAAVLLPTAVLWFGWHAARNRLGLARWTGGRTLAIGLAATLVGITALYVGVGAYSQDYYFYSGGTPTPTQLFLPVSTAWALSPYPPYTLVSSAHFTDVLGSLWALSSAAVLFCVLALLPRCRADRGVIVLAPAVVLALVHNFVLNPALGFPFDWDLMCVVSPPLLFLGVYLLAKSRPAPRVIAPLLLGLGLATVTLFAVNANPITARLRVQDMGLWLHRSYYAGAHYRLNASFAGFPDVETDIRERERVFRRMLAQARRDDHEAALQGNNLGLLMFNNGRVDDALRVFRLVAAVDPNVRDHRKPLGILEVLAGDRTRGMALLQNFLEIHPEDALCWKTLGDAWLANRRPALARQCWSIFLRLAPASPDAPQVREALAGLKS